MEISSYAPGGYRGLIVTVEVDCRTGIPGLDIVGLPASEVREARERARVAIRNSGFVFPTRRILVNLAPADVPKSGNGFDLAIAVAVLQASSQLATVSGLKLLAIGELRLDGRVAPVRGVLAAAAEAADAGVAAALVPEANLGEAAAVGGLESVGIRTLQELPTVLARLTHVSRTGTPFAKTQRTPDRRSGDDWTLGTQNERDEPTMPNSVQLSAAPLSDYQQLNGMGSTKRVLEIAASGGHHVLVVGPPGAGKSAALSLFPTIQTGLSGQESIEVTRIHSLAGELPPRGGVVTQRPFRMPHPNSSTQGVLGGGNPVLPGEAALAHRGALFLDEGLEFNRPVLQGLREPMEKHQIRLSRAGRRFWYPAAFQLLFATNPCPCGMLGREDRVCLCSVHEVERYWKRLGGPLLDRIDLRIYVAPEGDISARGETSAQIQARVYAARVMSYRRNSGRPNADLTGQEALDAAALQPSTNELLTRVVRSFGFSARAAVSLLRVARTIADLEQETSITESHLLEAVAYRRLGEENPPWEPPL